MKYSRNSGAQCKRKAEGWGVFPLKNNKANRFNQ
jgi:hypothetical protein